MTGKISKSYLVVVIWLVGNLFCLALQKDFWPFSAFGMFTQYRQINDVYFIKTTLSSDDKNLLYESYESNLPVIRYWQNLGAATPSETEKTNYAHTWISRHPYLSPKQGTFQFKVSKLQGFPDHPVETDLIHISTENLQK